MVDGVGLALGSCGGTRGIGWGCSGHLHDVFFILLRLVDVLKSAALLAWCWRLALCSVRVSYRKLCLVKRKRERGVEGEEAITRSHFHHCRCHTLPLLFFRITNGVTVGSKIYACIHPLPYALPSISPFMRPRV